MLLDSWKKGLIRVPLHLSGGNEFELIRVFEKIKEDDWVISTHRNHYHYLLKNGNADELFNEILGTGSELFGGNSGSMHTTDLSNRFISSCLVGCGAPISCGIAYAIKLNGGRENVWCFVGDGAVDQGMFWESLHWAEGMDLPVTFIVEDNDRSVDSSKEDRGVRHSPSRLSGLLLSKKVIYYSFKPKYPHVGNGEHISF